MATQPAMRYFDDTDDCGVTDEALAHSRSPEASLDRMKLPSNVVKSAGRVIQILEFFDDLRSAANVIEVARALGIPQSSASMLLRSLVAMGYLHHDPVGRTYQPTSRVGLLGNWVEPSLLRGGALVELMRDLNAATEVAVVLAARNGLYTQYLHVEQASSVTSVNVPIGAMRPIATSASGPIFLSALSANEVAKLVRRINAYATPGDELIRANDLIEQIKQFRRDNFVYLRREAGPGFSVLAVPLKSEVENAPLALSLAGRSELMDNRLDFLVGEVRRRLAAHFRAATPWRDAEMPRHSVELRTSGAGLPERRGMLTACNGAHRSAHVLARGQLGEGPLV